MTHTKHSLSLSSRQGPLVVVSSRWATRATTQFQASVPPAHLRSLSGPIHLSEGLDLGRNQSAFAFYWQLTPTAARPDSIMEEYLSYATGCHLSAAFPFTTASPTPETISDLKLCDSWGPSCI